MQQPPINPTLLPMSIRIVPESERTGAVAQAEPVLRPSAALPYVRRAARLRQLAQGHAMADYLLWAAQLADAQQHIAEQNPLPDSEVMHLVQALRQRVHTPLHSAHWRRSGHWLLVLDKLLEQLRESPRMQNPAIAQTATTLLHASAPQRNAWADALLAHFRGDDVAPDHPLPDAGVGLLVWTALSLYWRQLASSLPAVGEAALGAQRHVCPVCSHVPTGSLILGGARAGLRYVQCSLCESQWHVVRSTCTNCGETAQLDYWSLDSEKTAIKAESCGACQTYLKAFYVQTDPQLEMLADDLASVALDAEMDGQHLMKTSVNPLMLPW